MWCVLMHKALKLHTGDLCPYDTTLMAESEKELKSLLMKVKEEGEKAGLKTLPTMCNNKDGPRGHYAKWNKSDGKRQILQHFSHIWSLKK